MAVAAPLIVAVGVGLDGGGRGVGEVAVDGAVAVVHGADEAARAALLLATAASALALEAAYTVARLVGVAVAVSSAIVAGGDVARFSLGSLAVALAELLLPALGAAGSVLLSALLAVLLGLVRVLRLGAGGLAGRDRA